MKKLKLPQPYASMVMSGALDIVPDLWGDVKYEEKIFIYADEVAKEFNDGLDYSKEIHRKVFNEMTLGNIPDAEFEVMTFLGYVVVHCAGTPFRYWSENIYRGVFVKSPHKFIYQVDDYNTKLHDLEDICAKGVKLNRPKIKGSTLYVPVGEEAWDMIRDREKCKEVCLFWEDYMNKIIPNSIFDDEETDICGVTFTHDGMIMEFFTGTGVTTAKPLFLSPDYIGVFNFDLNGLIEGKSIGFKEYDWGVRCKKDEYKNPRAYIIYTPMGNKR